MLKIISWNVNGLRAIAKKGFHEFLKEYEPDILLLQEIKVAEDQVPMDLKYMEGYEVFINSANRKGYSGTAIYTKSKPISVRYGIGKEEYDDEGRVLTAEFEEFYAISIYVPNSKRGLERLGYRQKWDREVLDYLKNLEKKKPVIIGGDFNVAHEEIDLARPKQNKGKHGFTDEEREGFDRYIKSGFIDAFRLFHDGPGHYTWWNYFGNAKANNVGWRIDYILVSESLKKQIKDAYILSKVEGSDHCPVGIEIDI